jgi:hypothetical protein
VSTASAYDFARQATQQLLEELITIIKDTKKFLYEQIPDVIKQLLRFKLYEYVIYGVFRLGFLITLITADIWAWHILTGAIGTVWGSLAGVVLSVGFLVWIYQTACVLCSHTITIIKIGVAPKIYLIEFLVDWTKKLGN